MASDRRLAANRANAVKSTGPRTAAGKSKASSNSLRHGLNVSSNNDLLDEDVESLAARLLTGDDDLLAAARTAALAHLHLQRIRRLKSEALRSAILVVEAGGREDPKPLAGDEILALALLQAARPLKTLDEYERKAVSRRKRALREVIG